MYPYVLFVSWRISCRPCINKSLTIIKKKKIRDKDNFLIERVLPNVPFYYDFVKTSEQVF